LLSLESTNAISWKVPDSGKEAGAAQSLFNNLPRHIKHMPLVEALVGSTSNELYDATFDVDLTSELDPSDYSDEDIGILVLRSINSREDIQSGRTSPSPARGSRGQKESV